MPTLIERQRKLGKAYEPGTWGWKVYKTLIFHNVAWSERATLH